MLAVRHRILLALIVGLMGSTTAFSQTHIPESQPVTVQPAPAPAPATAPVLESVPVQMPATAPVTSPAPAEVIPPGVVTQAPAPGVPVTQTPVIVGEAGQPACAADCAASNHGKCQTCTNCTVVETTKKKADKEIHGKCKDICWPCSCPITTIWALICHEKPQYVCKGRTIHVAMKKTINKDVCITVCKTPEQIAADAKKDAAATAAPASLPIRRSGL